MFANSINKYVFIGQINSLFHNSSSENMLSRVWMVQVHSNDQINSSSINSTSMNSNLCQFEKRYDCEVPSHYQVKLIANF